MKKSFMLNLKRINLLLLALIMLIPQLSGIASADTPSGTSQFLTDHYYSASFGKEMNYRIYLPQGYEQGDRKYPVVYLLHQEGEALSAQFQTDKVNEKLDQWISAGTIQKMIVVMPDTSADSYYVNKTNEPWENLIANDLVPAIDAKYRTIALPKFRGISGVSMGGFGAVVLAMKHPELFTSVGSLMGDLNNTVSGLKPLTLLKAKTTAEARAYNYYFDGGTDDPFTYATDSTNDFHAYLRTKSAAHGYQTRPGGHTSEYYLKVMDRLFMMHSNSFSAGLVTGSFTATPQAISSTTTNVGVNFTTTLNRTSVANFINNSQPSSDYNMSVELAVTNGEGTSTLYTDTVLKGDVVTGSVLTTFTGTFNIPVSALTGTNKNFNVTLTAKLLGSTFTLGTKPLVKVTPTGTLPEDTQIDLLGDWKFIKDSNTPVIQAMNDNVDTTSWSTVQPGFDWWIDGFGGYSGLNNYSGTAWYRKEFFVPADFPNKDLTLMAGKIDDADMTYINGVKVGETGFANGAYTASFWAMSREYVIPENLLKRGQTNVIAIRVYNANGGGGIYSGPMGVYSKAAVQKIKNLPSKVPNQTITDQVSALIQKQSDAITTRDIKGYRDTISENYFEKGIDKLKLVDKMSGWMSTYSLLSVQIQNPYIFELDGKFLYTAVSTITGTTANGTTSTLSQGTISQYYQYDNGVLKEYGDQKLFYKTEFYSPALGRNNVMRVYLPKSYLTNPDKRYPTIYLFHQLNSDSESYEIDKINEIVDKGIADGTMKDMIIAIPDSAGTSWWVNQTGTNGIKWQDMVIKDLVPYMDLNYRTINDARYRGTSGVSMGGFGSFSLGFQFPELFSTAASHMGAINSTNAGINPTTIIKNYPSDALKRYSIYFDAGNTDVYSFENAVNGLHTYLKGINVPHYAEVRDGAHDSAFYTKSIDLSFAQHSRHFASSNVPNDVFTGNLSIDTVSANKKVSYNVTAASNVSTFADHIPTSPYIAANKQNPALKIPVIVELYNTTTHAKVYSYRDMFETATANSFTGELAIPKNLDAGTYEAALKVDLLDSSYEVARKTFAVDYEGSTLVGPATVVGGQALDITYGLANVTQSVYAKELSVNFDTTKLQFVNVDSLIDGFTVVGETDSPGKIRLLMARSNPAITITGTQSLLKLHFQAKTVSQTVTTSVYLSRVIISDGSGNEVPLTTGDAYQVSVQVDKSVLASKITTASAITNTGYTSITWTALQTALSTASSINNDANATQSQIDSAAANLQSAINGLVAGSNLTALNAKIAEAQAKASAAVVGVRWGQYSQSALNTFNAAITTARGITADVTQSTIDQAVVTLNQAIQAFDAAGRLSASIGDLGIVSANYGATSSSPNWNSIKIYDSNQDNKLNIIDIAAMATKILAQ